MNFNVLFGIFRAFLLPADQQLDLQYWAETGEYDAEELYEVSTQLIKPLIKVSGVMFIIF